MFEGFQIGLGDAVQIALLSVAVYALVSYLRGTRAGQVLAGVIWFVSIPSFFIWLFGWDVLGRIFFGLLLALGASMIVVFQEEIRRGLALIGGTRLFGATVHSVEERAPERLVKAIRSLAASRTGALIALERGISLTGYEISGIRIGAQISGELLISIFTPPLPLHDGGIIVRNGAISAAHCIFPVSGRADLIASGMRHRAAVGLSEETDAVVVVVSEERGTIAIAHNGVLHRYSNEVTDKMLLRWIRKAMSEKAVARPRFADTVLSLFQSFRRRSGSGASAKGGR